MKYSTKAYDTLNVYNYNQLIMTFNITFEDFKNCYLEGIFSLYAQG